MVKDELVGRLKSRISARLKALNKSRNDASQEAGRDRNFLLNLFNKGSLPGLDFLSDLAPVLQCKVAYLIGETDEPLGAPNAEPDFQRFGEKDALMVRALHAALCEIEERIRRAELNKPVSLELRVEATMERFWRNIIQMQREKGAPLTPEAEADFLLAVKQELEFIN